MNEPSPRQKWQWLRKLRSFSFWAGVMTTTALQSLAQDFRGKEDYLMMMDKNWIDPSVTVPFALALLVWAWYLHFHYPKIKQKEPDNADLPKI